MTDYGIKTYADLAKTAGQLVLANNMGNRPMNLVNGTLDDETEIFQWFIISNPSFLMEHTDELVFYDEELDLYVLGVTHYGTPWELVPAPQIY